MDLDWQICPPLPPYPTSIYDRNPAFGDGPPYIATPLDSERYLANNPQNRRTLGNLPPLNPSIPKRMPLILRPRDQTALIRRENQRKKMGLPPLMAPTRWRDPDSSLFPPNHRPHSMTNPLSRFNLRTSSTPFHPTPFHPKPKLDTFKLKSLTPRKRFLDEENLFPEPEPHRGCFRSDFKVSSKVKEDATNLCERESFPPAKIINQKADKVNSQPTTEYNPPPYPPFDVDLPLVSADDIKSHADWSLYYMKIYEAEAKGIDPFYSRVYPYMPGGWPESPPATPRPSLRPTASKTEPPFMSGALTESESAARETVPTSPVDTTTQPYSLGDGSSQHATPPLMAFHRIISTVADAPRQVKRTIGKTFQAALQVAHSVKRRAISILDHREVIDSRPPSPSIGRVLRLEVTTTEQRLAQRARRWLAERRRPRDVPLSFAENLSAVFARAIYGESTHPHPTELQNSVAPSSLAPSEGMSIEVKPRVKALGVKRRTVKHHDGKPRNSEARRRLATVTFDADGSNHLHQMSRNSGVEKPRRVRSINPRTAIKGQVVYFEKDCILPWHATPRPTYQPSLWDEPWPCEKEKGIALSEFETTEITMPSPPLGSPSQLSTDTQREADEELPEDPTSVGVETGKNRKEDDTYTDSHGEVWTKVRIANRYHPLHIAWFDPGTPSGDPVSSIQPFNSESPVTSLHRLKPLFSAKLRGQKKPLPRLPARAVRPLSATWDVRVSEIEGMNNDEQAATTLSGDPLRVRDLSTCFTSRAWLNDEIINAYLAILVKYLRHVSIDDTEADKPKFHAFNSFFFSNLRDKGYAAVGRWATRAKIGKESLLGVDTVFIPVHHTSHWTLIVVRPGARTIEHFDSLGSLSPAHIAKIKEWLQGELGPLFVESEWSVLPSISPQQNNGSDCGVFLLTTAKAVTVGLDPLSYGAADIPIIRRKIVAELVNGGLEGEFDPREFEELKL
ncbi:hypothetical protein Egran_02947 [Elaphomyces granulatus]|uniref:Ubiquitin-like protease family profile domain-containing protein n=1 Tax=Elaphomyces granulatus TaxID=519963 RepID=A0A232LYQ2_9EURO|nr:hypothetical protein Egran_02947 [Elaphomyces granulatus]